MSQIDQLLSSLRPLVPLLAVIAGVMGALFAVRYLMERRYGDAPSGRFRIQLVMLALSLVGVLAIVVALPVGESLRVQLLSLIGILLSASIALSSTTFLGNALAGILLRVVRSFRLGDFIRVGEHFGRASERGLFHTEIQTEDRDLTTLPNLYLVTHPVRVVRETGTIVSATVSLGYDVPRGTVEGLLLEAAGSAGLQEPFVHVTELGDFSVTYRVAGLLTEVKQLLSTRSQLRAAMLDALHGAEVEIVSPNFMNTRTLAEGSRILPHAAPPAEPSTAAAAPAEEVVFDKAEEAESIEQINGRHEALGKRLEELRAAAKEAGSDAERERLETEIGAAESERERLGTVLRQAEERSER